MSRTAISRCWNCCTCVSRLGFEGKYRLDPQGAARLAEIRQNLYRRISGLRDGVEPELSPRWKGVEDRRNAVLRFVPLWVVAAACAVVLLGGYLYFDSKLSAKADPINATLAGVGLESFDAPAVAAPNVPASGLRELLSAQISSGQIYFDEAGGRTAITLAVPDLFASGNTRINEQHASLVHQIGAALNQVPGRIVVIGHTDNPTAALAAVQGQLRAVARARRGSRGAAEERPS